MFNEEIKAVNCPDHPKASLIEDYRSGERICRECGLVVGDRIIDLGSEWRTFNSDKAGGDQSRVGGAENPLLSGSGLTTILVGRGDASFEKTPYSKQQTKQTEDRILTNAFREIEQMAGRLNLAHNAIDAANNLFKDVYDKKTLKGRSNDAIASACLYIACRQQRIPRTFKEVCAVSKISKKEIGRCYKMALKAADTSVELITTEDFIPRFCTNLGLPISVEQAATTIAQCAVEMDMVAGRSPISVAAAAIYMASQASQEKKSQKEISEVAGVADVTIRQSYKLMYPQAELLFPPNFEFFTDVEELPLN